MARIDTIDTEWGAIVVVTISDNQKVDFPSFKREHAQMRGMVFKALDERCEESCELRKDTVPAEIEGMGKAAIASYLFAVHAEGYEGTAARLEVSVETVKQYLSDFRHGRR